MVTSNDTSLEEAVAADDFAGSHLGQPSDVCSSAQNSAGICLFNAVTHLAPDKSAGVASISNDWSVERKRNRHMPEWHSVQSRLTLQGYDDAVLWLDELK